MGKFAVGDIVKHRFTNGNAVVAGYNEGGNILLHFDDPKEERAQVFPSGWDEVNCKLVQPFVEESCEPEDWS